MGTAPSAKETRKPPRWRKWLKRVSWTLVALILAMVIFHRPLLRWGLNWGAPRLAKAAGYDLQWQVRGSIISDLSVRDIKLKGPEDSVLKSITLHEVEADYDLWTLIRQGPANFLHGLSLSDATIELDMRVPPKPAKKKKSGKAPPAVWAQRVDLRNVNLRITTKDGDIHMRGLSLLLDEDVPGELKIAELIMPATNLHLTQVRGRTSLKDRKLTITDLVLTPEVNVAQLEVGLGELEKSALPFEIRMQLGEGSLHAKGRVDGLGDRPTLDASVTLRQVAHTEIARWVKLPENQAWHIEDASLQLRGPPAHPQSLEATLMLNARDLQVAKVKADRLQARAGITGGKLRMESLTVQAGSNTADLSGSADLPPTWPEMRRLSADLQWKLAGSNLEQLFAEPLDIAGSLDGSGTLALKEGRLAGAQGTINGKQVRYRQWTLSSLTADVTTDAQSVKINSITARLDDRNSLKVDGQINLVGRQEADLKWSAELGDVSAVARSAGWQGADSLRTEKFSGGGEIRFQIADLKEKNYRNLSAKGSIALEGLSWDQRRMQSASMEFAMQGGRAEIRKADVVFDEQNRGRLSGTLRMEERQPFDLGWVLELQNVSSMGAWFAWRPDMPLPETGTINSQGTASGSLADLRERVFTGAKAEGTLQLENFVSGTARCERASLDFNSSNGRVELKQLEVKFDPANQISARGHAMIAKPGEFSLEAEGALMQLQNLSGWIEMFKGPPLTGGSATISWRGGGKFYEGDLRGNGSLNVTDLKLADRPAFSVALATQHDGRKAQITGLRASTGKFRVEAQASVSHTDVSIAPLSVFSGDLALVSGSVQIPMALAQTPRPAVPVDVSRPVDISLRITELDLTKLFAAFGMKPPVTGMANGEVELHGKLPDLEGKVILAVTGVRAQALKGKLEAATLRLDALLAQDRMTFRASVDQKPLRTITLTGAMPLDAEKLTRNPSGLLDTEFEARVVLPQSDLSIVRRFVPAIATLQGSIAADVKLSGALRSPHWEGAINAEAPSATFQKTPMDIKDLKARISFDDKQIKVDDVSAILAGGELRVVGGMDVTDLKNPVLDLRLDAREALLVRNESISARTNATVTCKGSLAKAEVVGRADLVRCRVFKEIEFLPLSLPNQLPPAPPPVRPRAPPSLPPPFDQWTLNLDIATKDSIRLLGNVFNGSATTNLHLGGTGAAPELEGEVSFEGARVRLPNSRLTITRGKLIFTKDKPFEPMLDVIGESLIGNYEVSVNAYGPALKPKLRFTSSPPLSESEIATLLATGTVGGGEQAAAGAAASTAAFQLLSKAYRSVFDKAAPKRYDEEPPRLTFSFSALNAGTSQPGVTANYEISPKLQASGTVTERGTFRGMLYYMVRLR